MLRCYLLLRLINLLIFSHIAGFRSISAVDTAAVQRARARAQYSNMARLKVTAGTASLRKFFVLNCFVDTMYSVVRIFNIPFRPLLNLQIYLT